MKTIITYNVPDEEIDGILSMLGYVDGDKAEFMNNAIKSVVLPAISDKFITIKQWIIAKMAQEMPQEVISTVGNMISITTE